MEIIRHYGKTGASYEPKRAAASGGARSPADGPHEVPDLLIDLARLGDGLRNFLSQQFAVALTEPMRRGLDVSHSELEPLRNLRVRDGISIPPKVSLKRVEEVNPPA